MSKKPNTFYHAAPRALRKSILTEGLLPAIPDNDYPMPEGVYLSAVAKAAFNVVRIHTSPEAEIDIFEIDTTGLEIRVDPWDEIEKVSKPINFYIPGNIEAKRICLLGTA